MKDKNELLQRCLLTLTAEQMGQSVNPFATDRLIAELRAAVEEPPGEPQPIADDWRELQPWVPGLARVENRRVVNGRVRVSALEGSSRDGDSIEVVGGDIYFRIPVSVVAKLLGHIGYRVEARDDDGEVTHYDAGEAARFEAP